MTDSTNPRVMADNIRELSAGQAAQGTKLEAEIEALGSYSATEVDTGKKWIDGKSIYRRVIIGNTPAAEGSPLDTNQVYDKILKIDGVVLSGGSYTYDLNKYIQVVGLGGSVIRVNRSSNSDYQDAPFILIAEYTKAPTPDVLPSPDPGTRVLEESKTEFEPEPIEEKK